MITVDKLDTASVGGAVGTHTGPEQSAWHFSPPVSNEIFIRLARKYVHKEAGAWRKSWEG